MSARSLAQPGHWHPASPPVGGQRGADCGDAAGRALLRGGWPLVGGQQPASRLVEDDASGMVAVAWVHGLTGEAHVEDCASIYGSWAGLSRRGGQGDAVRVLSSSLRDPPD